MEKEGWIAVQHLSKTCFFRVGLLDHRTVLGSVSWELDAVSGSRHLCVQYLALRLVSGLLLNLGCLCVTSVSPPCFAMRNAPVGHAWLPHEALLL